MRLYVALLCLSAVLHVTEGAEPCVNRPQASPVVVKAIGGDVKILGVSALFGPELPTVEPPALRLAIAEPANACSPLTTKVDGKAVLVSRGNCTFAEKADHVEAAGGALALIMNTEPDGVVSMDCGDSKLDLGPMPGIALAMLPKTAGEALMSELRSRPSLEVSVWAPEIPAWDLSSGFMWLIACGTVYLGGLLAKHDWRVERASEAGEAKDGQPPTAGQQRESFEVSARDAVVFVVAASIALVTMAVFVRRIMTVLRILFCVASAQGAAAMLELGISRASPGLGRRHVRVPFLGPVRAAVLLSTALGVALAAVWFGTSGWSGSWVLQDLLGVAFVLHTLRTLRLPNLKVACVLLPLVLCYDVFWVFIQPRLSKSPSVMVVVATSGGSGESMPMVLRLPHLSDPLGGFGLLGFGDMVLPGLLISLCGVVDERDGLSGLNGYLVPSVVAYGVGLLATFSALALQIGGQGGQPALLYLVPCVLGTVLALSYRRGDLRKMWGATLEPSRRALGLEDAEEGGQDATEADGPGRGEGARRQQQSGGGLRGRRRGSTTSGGDSSAAGEIATPSSGSDGADDSEDVLGGAAGDPPDEAERPLLGSSSTR